MFSGNSARCDVCLNANQSSHQVEILQLENNLTAARQRLGEMRKISYQEE